LAEWVREALFGDKDTKVTLEKLQKSQSRWLEDERELPKRDPLEMIY